MILLLSVFPLSAQVDTLSYGESRAGRLLPAETDSYLFEGFRDERVTIRIAGVATSFDGELALLDPSGNPVSVNVERQGEVRRLNATLRTSGFHTIRIRNTSGEDQGDYGLSLQKVNPALRASTLSNADQGNGRINQLAEVRSYTFCGMPGDRIQINMEDQTASIVSQIELFSPQGELMARFEEQAGSGIRIDTTLSESGLYTILVSDATGTGTGSFRLAFSSSGNCTVTDIQQNLCDGQSFIFNGLLYNEFRPFGVAQMSDTFFVIQLNFPPPAVSNLYRTLCSDGFITVNGTRYDASRPTGQEILKRQASTGCDSIVNIDLSFADTLHGTLKKTLCEEETLTVNGTVYGRDNPSGTEFFPGGSAGGCDSIVEVRLEFQSGATELIERTFCREDEFIVVNGTVYDLDNPEGTERIPGGAGGDCDSIIQVRLEFQTTATRMIRQTLCPDEFITVNGTVYDLDNPSGTERIPGGAGGGCDSVIQVQLEFQPPAGKVEDTLCPDEFITVNGVIYDQRNPEGTERIPAGAFNGCDSIIQVDLEFYPEASTTLSQTLCTGEFITINGKIYDQENPRGMEFLFGEAANGCDSIVEVNLSFQPVASAEFSRMICPDESVTINGRAYDQSNLTGVEVISGGASNGCDSIVYVQLTLDNDCAVGPDFYIPSGITPNGDGINDRFTIPVLNTSPQQFDNNELIIKNRWGDIVYEATPYQNEWEGVAQNGAPLPAGTYFFSFRYGPDKGAVRQGKVTIIR